MKRRPLPIEGEKGRIEVSELQISLFRRHWETLTIWVRIDELHLFSVHKQQEFTPLQALRATSQQKFIQGGPHLYICLLQDLSREDRVRKKH